MLHEKGRTEPGDVTFLRAGEVSVRRRRNSDRPHP
jgi:hypothetical protein